MVGKGMRAGPAARIFGLAATYVGTVVGAGFASGQEIWTFFVRFGWAGFFGLALSGALFALAGLRALALGACFGPRATQFQALAAIAGSWAPLLDLVLLVFLIVLSGVMLAGAGAMAGQYSGPAWVGILLTASLALLVIRADVPGLTAANEVVVPILVLATISLALASLGAPGTSRPGTYPPSWGWPLAALLYASYNTALALPVLSAMGAAEVDAAVRRAGALWGAFGLFFVGGLVAASLLRQPDLAARSEVPMAAIAGRIAKPFAWLYGAVLWAELFTTLVADSYGAAVRLGQLFGGSRTLWAGITMILGMLLSRLGFARLVRTAYPAFGLVSLVILAGLIAPGPRREEGAGS